MKVFEVKGILTSYEEQDHANILIEIHDYLKSMGYHFSGITIEVKEK